MALDDFKVAFDNAYQEFFPKVLVAMKIANTRLLEMLSYGQSVTRVRYDISGVRVRSITVGADMTIDSVTDTGENLTVDQWKGTAFALSEKEKTQAGPLNPGTVIGTQTAIKLATYVDADVLYETVNAFAAFDTGDLTTGSSNGTPIALSSTTVPQMVSRLPAKLRRNNQLLQNLALVADATTIADMFQYLLGKNADFVNALFQNGYVNEQVASAEVYQSENVTGEGLLSMVTQPTDGDTVVIQGVTFTFKTVLGVTAGNVLIGGSADAARANLAALINAPGTTTAQGVALSAADQLIIADTIRATATNDNAADTLTLVAKGSGRLTLSETFTDATDTWTRNFVHVYFGKKGAIDIVAQKDVKMDMRPEPKQPADNIISRILYGVKTFYDGKQKFLDVKISAV